MESIHKYLLSSVQRRKYNVVKFIIQVTGLTFLESPPSLYVKDLCWSKIWLVCDLAILVVCCISDS